MRSSVCSHFLVLLALATPLCSSQQVALTGSQQQKPLTKIPQQTPQEQLWRFDNLQMVGGQTVEVVGHPQLINTEWGKAVQFNGLGDGLLVHTHPLAAASTYTWEVFFRPDADGPEAQRFFHLQEQDPTTGQDTQNRMLFELRIVDGQWCLDSFTNSFNSRRTLLNCKALHPLGQWFRVEAVFDGHMLRNYVNGELQGEGELTLRPQQAGRSSIGTRINNTYPFKGAILLSRTLPRALTPAEFLAFPPPIAAHAH